MKRVSTVELIRNFGAHSDAALAMPVIVTKNGRDRLVLISIEQYDVLQHAYDAFEDTRAKAPQERAKTSARGQCRAAQELTASSLLFQPIPARGFARAAGQSATPESRP